MCIAESWDKVGPRAKKAIVRIMLKARPKKSADKVAQEWGFPVSGNIYEMIALQCKKFPELARLKMARGWDLTGLGSSVEDAPKSPN